MASYQFTEGDVIANTMVCIDVNVPSAGTAVDLVVSVGIIDSTTIRCNAEGNARSKWKSLLYITVTIITSLIPHNYLHLKK